MDVTLNGDFERRVHMRIGIIGTASMGGILARHLAKLSHHVSIVNSRGPESLTALAAEIDATPVSVVHAAHAGEIVESVVYHTYSGRPKAKMTVVKSLAHSSKLLNERKTLTNT
jgi:pyrroline-5-carboxylate reductase